MTWTFMFYTTLYYIKLNSRSMCSCAPLDGAFTMHSAWFFWWVVYDYITNCNICLFLWNSQKVILQAILTKARKSFKSPSCSQWFSHWISHWWSNMNEKIKVIIFALQCICSHCFFNSCFIQTCSTSLPVNSYTSKILGVSIPDWVCITKHKTNICCRGKTKHGGPFQRLVGHFHTGSLSAGGQHCQSPALPLSFLSYFPVEAMLFLSGV